MTRWKFLTVYSVCLWMSLNMCETCIRKVTKLGESFVGQYRKQKKKSTRCLRVHCWLLVGIFVQPNCAGQTWDSYNVMSYMVVLSPQMNQKIWASVLALLVLIFSIWVFSWLCAYPIFSVLSNHLPSHIFWWRLTFPLKSFIDFNFRNFQFPRIEMRVVLVDRLWMLFFLIVAHYLNTNFCPF